MLTKLWMQQNVIQITSDTPLSEAKDIFEQHNFRHLPVTEDNKLLGIITQTDINKALPSPVDSTISPQERIIAAQTKVSAFMASNPVTVTPMDPLEDVALLLRKHKIGAIPVVEEGLLKGIITESDIFDAFAAIMDGEASDVRIELQIDKGGTALYTTISLCKKFNAPLHAISIYNNYSPDHQLVTIRVNGEETDKLIDALWDGGMKINQVTRQNDT